MKIRDLTVPELNHYRQYCNFTPMESQFFELRAADISVEECAATMNCSVSTAKSYGQRVKSKMSRV